MKRRTALAALPLVLSLAACLPNGTVTSRVSICTGADSDKPVKCAYQITVQPKDGEPVTGTVDQHTYNMCARDTRYPDCAGGPDDGA